MKIFNYCFYVSAILTAMLGGCQSQTGTETGLSPDEALSTFELRPGFNIELVASEPLVSDPVDMAIDENGNLYVVEMHGYPLDESGSDRVKLLRDTDGDGRMDKATIFADSLVLPTGIMRWKRGVLVTAPPDVWYMEDTDGDSRADIKRKILTGFALSNPQHNMNNPLYGLDNWIYLAHGQSVDTKLFPGKFGDKGSQVYYPDHPAAPRLPKNANNRDVRFRPDTDGLEILSGRSQFGQTFDRWGHQFLVNNSNHIYQEVIEARYLRRNSGLPVATAIESLSDHGNACDVYPITKDPDYQLLTDVGVITSACGLTAYQGGLFPTEFDRTTFVAEPVSNLVHVDRLKDHGPSFVASRLRAEKEFLASTDAWFRPVNMYIGPDGALYVVDYYRQIIEHPEWMSKEVLESGNLYNGSHKGRIYRITPSGAAHARWPQGLELGQTSSEQLVDKLADPNIWWRSNAQRLLVDREDASVVPKLEQMVRQNLSSAGRLHALWTLEGLGRLQPSLIRKALQDSVDGIRENAIKLAELHLKDSPSLTDELLAMQSDTNAKVRYQLLCTLGFVDTPQAAHVRQKLLFGDIDNKWMQLAALSAPASQNTALLSTVIRRFKPPYESLVQRLSAMTTANESPERVHTLILKATRSGGGAHGAWQAPMLDGIAEGLTTRQSLYPSVQQDEQQFVQAFFEHPAAAVRRGCLGALQVTGLSDGARTQAAVERVVHMAGKKDIAIERRVEALDFLALTDPAPYASLLEGLVDPHEPTAVQTAALHALSAIPGTTVSEYVLKQWSVLTPGVRQAALTTFLTRPFKPVRIELLLGAIEAGTIQPGSIDWRNKVHLMSINNDSLRNEARSLLAGNRGQNRQEIQQYLQAVRQQASDPEQGRKVFLQNCAICHQMGNASGAGFGPDLGTVRSWRPSDIIENILDPNMAISNGYGLWRIELKTGEIRRGIISTETSNAVTLRNQQGEETTFARPSIKSLQALHMSPMPTDFGEKISSQEMADLVAFIRHTK